MEEGSQVSQQSFASSTAETKYAKLQDKYFHDDESDDRDSGIGEMGSMEYSDRSPATSDLPTPEDSFVGSPEGRYPSRNKTKPKDSAPFPGFSSLSTAKPPVSRNKLINQAMEDSKTYLVLGCEEIHRMKTELMNLNTRSESLKNRLGLETKVRDAALSLRKLHASNKKLVSQADDQLEAANRKLDQVTKEMWDVAQRTWSHQRQLMQHTAAVLAIAATQPMEQVSTKGSFAEPATLKDALAALSIKENELQILRTQAPAPKCQCHKLDSVRKELDEQKARVVSLEKELDDNHELSQLLAGERVDKQDLFRQVQALKREIRIMKTDAPSPTQESLKIKLKEATEEADLLYRRNLETNEQLTQLYLEIPELHHSPDQESHEQDTRFTMEKFADKIDGLVQENHDLIDKILELQERNVQLTRRLATSDPSSLNDEKLSLTEVEDIVAELQSLLEQVEDKADHLQSELARERSNNQALYKTKQNIENELTFKISQLQSELETKDILCTKYQQILNAI